MREIKPKQILIVVVSILIIVFLCLTGCPVQKLLGVPCPACGTTRAWLCVFRGDFVGAFSYNLFFAVYPLIIIVFLLDYLGLIKKRKFITVSLIIVAALAFIYNIIRFLVN